jgi:hypothetical protein
LEIELVKSAKAIRDVNFDGRRPGGLAVGSGDREFNPARPRPTIDWRGGARLAVFETWVLAAGGPL